MHCKHYFIIPYRAKECPNCSWESRLNVPFFILSSSCIPYHPAQVTPSTLPIWTSCNADIIVFMRPRITLPERWLLSFCHLTQNSSSADHDAPKANGCQISKDKQFPFIKAFHECRQKCLPKVFATYSLQVSKIRLYTISIVALCLSLIPLKVLHWKF